MRRSLHLRTILASLTMLIAIAAAPRRADAAQCIWQGTTASWNVAANWGGTCATVPQDGDDVVFPEDASAVAATTNDIAGLDLNSLTISGRGAGGARYSIGGTAFTLGNTLSVTTIAGGGLGPLITAAITLSSPLAVTVTQSEVTLGNINLNGNQLTLDPSASRQILLDGVISGSGFIAKTGAGHVWFNQNNTYTGNTQVLAGSAAIRHPNGLGAAGGANGTFVCNGCALELFNPGGAFVVPESMTLAGPGTGGADGALWIPDSTIEVSGDIVLAAFTRIHTSTGGANLILSGSITGGAAILSKSGPGRLTLTGPNNFPLLQFDAGQVFVNGSQAPVQLDMAVTASVLGGNGISGPTNVTVGTIAPGAIAGPSLMTVGNFTLGGTAAYEVQLTGAAPGAGYDQLVATGTVQLAGDLTGSLSFAAINGQQFTIINKTSAGAVVGTLNGVAEGGVIMLGGQPFTISYVGGDGNDVVLTYSPLVVPTMPTIGLLALALTLALVALVRMRG